MEESPVAYDNSSFPTPPPSSPGEITTTITLTLERPLGRGATCRVYIGHIDDLEVAVKIVCPSVGMWEHESHIKLVNEAAIYHHLRDIQGEHVPFCGGLWRSSTCSILLLEPFKFGLDWQYPTILQIPVPVK